MANILNLKSFQHRNLVISSVALSLALIAFILLIKENHLPPQIPLFYGLAQGESQLAPTNFLVLPLVFSSLLLLVNLLISFFLKDDFLKKSLIVAGVVTIVFSLITVLRIIFLVSAF